jgi:hypothetical protein
MCRNQPLRGWSAVGAIMSEERERAAQEAAYCERLLAKSGENILRETLRDAPVAAWTHYPAGDAFDPESGGQWYYHCHVPAADGVEHGHFHCFVRPHGAQGPVHHLVAIGVDAYGKLHRLFTVNQWVVGDSWLDAEGTIGLLSRFNMELAKPSYLVNRWLTAIVRQYQPEIEKLILERDAVLATQGDFTVARENRSLEVTSSLIIEA